MHYTIKTYHTRAFVLFLLIAYISSTWSQESWTAGKSWWVGNQEFALTDIENKLLNDTIVRTVPMSSFLRQNGKVVKGDSAIKLITLQSGLKAVFKTGEYRYAEVAAYKASKAINFDLVPPTVLRIIDGNEGSLQLYVDSAIDLLRVSNRHAFFKRIDPKEVSMMHCFYYVFGQWDTHRGNQIITKRDDIYHLALIDNAGMLHKQYCLYGKFPFIEKGENKTISSLQSDEFPFKLTRFIRPGPYEDLHDIFAPFVSEKQIRRLWSRHRPIRYVIWRNILWMQMHLYSESAKPSFTRKYYASTVRALKKLDRECLNLIWSEWLAVNPTHACELIELTLERRDQLVKAAETKGRILED